MKHATGAALDQIESLLQRVRALETLQERSRGVFYRRSSAFLHFHEDPAGMFADVRLTGDWERYPVNGPSEQAGLLRKINAWLVSANKPGDAKVTARGGDARRSRTARR
jgi:hypothetical protein